MASVTLSQLSKIYNPDEKDSFHAVKGIDLDIQDKEFMVLVGPSGCGKSTTLRMIAGLEKVTSGNVKIGDRIVNDLPPKDRGIAMVFQNYALYPHMSVYDNMAFGLKLQKIPSDEIETRVQDAAKILGLDPMLERKPKALSGGQRQRVAVGRSIVRNPEVFLFDEPLSNLDAKMRVQMRTEISKLHARLDATMIYVTHDQVEAMTMGTRICVMKDGEIMQVDSPLQLYHYPNNLFVAGFIGSPPMNLFNGEIQSADSHFKFIETSKSGQPPFQLALDPSLDTRAAPYVGRSIILGIRPESLSVIEAADATSFAATVDVVEPMGAETFLYLLSEGGHSFIAKITSETVFHPGQQIHLNLDFKRVHLFDPASENRI